MDQETREKLEAIIRNDSESLPYKYRDARDMYLYGIKPYKDLSKEEIDGIFRDLELEVTDEDKEWASYPIA